MPIPDIRVTPVARGVEFKEFVTFPWRVYAGDPNWVPPLISDARKMLDPARHPFHQHAEVQCFLARRGSSSGGESGQVVGRIAAIVNHLHNEVHGEKTGFFGFFDTMADATIPPYLFRAAADWLRERGMERMRGPASFSSNEEWGLLVEGFDRPPMVMMAYNPPAYARYLEDYGFVKAKDLIAYYMASNTPMPERLLRGAGPSDPGRNDRARSDEAPGDKAAAVGAPGAAAPGGETPRAEAPITIRRLNMNRFPEDVGKVREVYNAAWEKNWGFVPMTSAEIEHMAKELKPVVDPDLVLFAECEGRTVGFCMALPDVNRALKAANGRLYPFGLVRMLMASRRIKEVRVLTLGIVPQYRRRRIDMMFYLELWRTGLRKKMVGGEFSWILEDNALIRRALERLGARVYKTYRLYDYSLTP